MNSNATEISAASRTTPILKALERKTYLTFRLGDEIFAEPS